MFAEVPSHISKNISPKILHKFYRTSASRSLSQRTMTLNTIAHIHTVWSNTTLAGASHPILGHWQRPALGDANKLSQTGSDPCLSTSAPILAASRSLSGSSASFRAQG